MNQRQSPAHHQVELLKTIWNSGYSNATIERIGQIIGRQAGHKEQACKEMLALLESCRTEDEVLEKIRKLENPA